MTRLKLLEIYKTLFGRFLYFKKGKVEIIINQKLVDDLINDIEIRQRRLGGQGLEI